MNEQSTATIIDRLKSYNEWRRGNDCPQPDPKIVGEDIDSICEIVEQLERERDEAQTALDEIEKYGTEEINAAVDLRRQLAAALIERDEACEKLAAERALVDWLAGMVDPYYADDDIAHYAGIADAIAARKEARNDQTSSS